MLLAFLILAALCACIRYEKGSDRLFAWSKKKKAFIPLEDRDEGLDDDPNYTPPPVEIDWEREVPSIYVGERSSILIAGERDYELVTAQWGIVPVWADNAMAKADAEKRRPPKVPTDPAKFGKLNAYNTRNDSLGPTKGETKPTWRNAFHDGRRCVVPAEAFFERDMSIKHWIRIGAHDGGVLAIAGLWEPANQHVEVPTYSMVTTEPNLRVGEFHDRMPVMLDADGVEEWMDPKARPADLLRLLIPSPEDYLRVEDAGPIKKKAEDQESLL